MKQKTLLYGTIVGLAILLYFKFGKKKEVKESSGGGGASGGSGSSNPKFTLPKIDVNKILPNPKDDLDKGEVILPPPPDESQDIILPQFPDVKDDFMKNSTLIYKDGQYLGAGGAMLDSDFMNEVIN